MNARARWLQRARHAPHDTLRFRPRSSVRWRTSGSVWRRESKFPTAVGPGFTGCGRWTGFSSAANSGRGRGLDTAGRSRCPRCGRSRSLDERTACTCRRYDVRRVIDSARAGGSPSWGLPCSRQGDHFLQLGNDLHRRPQVCGRPRCNRATRGMGGLNGLRTCRLQAHGHRQHLGWAGTRSAVAGISGTSISVSSFPQPHRRCSAKLGAALAS